MSQRSNKIAREEASTNKLWRCRQWLCCAKRWVLKEAEAHREQLQKGDHRNGEYQGNLL